MSGDEDIARLLPEPPPPRPARRDATIALAMRRFDGDTTTMPAAVPVRARSSFGWGPTGAFASILLVALIGLPIALRNPGGDLPRPEPRSAPSAVERVVPNAPPANDARTSTEPREICGAGNCRPTAEAATANAPMPAAKPGEAAVAVGALSSKAGGDAGGAREVAAAPPPPPPAPSPPPPPPASQARDAVVAEDIGALPVIGRRRASSQAMMAPSAVTAMSEETLRENDNIVVTGTRPSRARKAPGRGGWNACTVDDPQQSLPRCERMIATAAKGSESAAAGQLSEGLQRAWRQDRDGAIAAFDQAIASQPRLALAWLNRGLVRQQAGDLAGAEADLDRAVRYAPRAARGYYHRSLVRQARGDKSGARADAARARELDSSFDAVIDD